MLISDLYTYKVISHADHAIEAIVSVNRESSVYRGHFPQIAVTPGVCQVLMIKEILQEEINTPLRIAEAKQIKFTAVHQPDLAREINVRISYSEEGQRIVVDGLLFTGETRYLKFKGEFSSGAE
jgi:3-hydroxyacyl-[acyl-carrier-protein] dehydratase